LGTYIHIHYLLLNTLSIYVHKEHSVQLNLCQTNLQLILYLPDMHLILSRRFLFKIPITLQRNHLLDIWHLDRAHRVTLFGVKVSKDCKITNIDDIKSLNFTLFRFGIPNKVVIQQNKKTGFTTVEVNNFKLEFTILEHDKFSHWLQVKLFSTCRWYLLLLPLVDLAFWLTVIEDKIYYTRFELKSTK